MFRISNNLIGCLNFVIFLVSVPIFATGVWLATRGGASECEKLMQGRAIAIGVLLMVVSLAGFVGACFRVTWLMWAYLVFMTLLILLQLAFVIFDLVVTSKGSNSGGVVDQRGYTEYRLDDFSPWLRDQVEDKDKWRMVKSCLINRDVCADLRKGSARKLSPIESGCCRPPAECGFAPQSNPTVWAKPPAGFTSANPDCKAWSNDNVTLCFDCNSCKAGTIAEKVKGAKAVAIAHAVLLAILIIVYAVGCHALKNNRDENAIRLKGFA